MTHALKTWPEFYKLVDSGRKDFELRKNDRDYKEGDKVLLQEYDPGSKRYTGKELERDIIYVLSNAEKIWIKKKVT